MHRMSKYTNRATPCQMTASKQAACSCHMHVRIYATGAIRSDQSRGGSEEGEGSREQEGGDITPNGTSEVDRQVGRTQEGNF